MDVAETPPVEAVPSPCSKRGATFETASRSDRFEGVFSVVVEEAEPAVELSDARSWHPEAQSAASMATTTGCPRHRSGILRRISGSSSSSIRVG